MYRMYRIQHFSSFHGTILYEQCYLLVYVVNLLVNTRILTLKYICNTSSIRFQIGANMEVFFQEPI